MELAFNIPKLEQTHNIAKTLSLFYQKNQAQFKQLNSPFIVNLEGDLGAGKTEFCRHFIQTIRPQTKIVNSPTFNIINTYSDFIFHIDCYRLANSEELEYLNIRENMFAGNIFLVEWASKVSYFFHPSFIHITIYQYQKVRLLNLVFPETQCNLTKQLQTKLNKCFVQLNL